MRRELEEEVEKLSSLAREKDAKTTIISENWLSSRNG